MIASSYLLHSHRIFPQDWALTHFAPISAALLSVVRSNRTPIVHLQVPLDMPFQLPLNQSTVVAFGLAHDALVLLCLSAITSSSDLKILDDDIGMDDVKPTVSFKSEQSLVIRRYDQGIEYCSFATFALNIELLLFRFLLTQLLPDLLSPKDTTRENSLRLIERISVMYDTSLVDFLQVPLGSELDFPYGRPAFIFSPSPSGMSISQAPGRKSTHCGDSPSSSSSSSPSTDTFDLITDAVANQSPDIQFTLLGQILLGISFKSFLSPASSSRAAILDVLAWLIGHKDPHIAFTESFLLR